MSQDRSNSASVQDAVMGADSDNFFADLEKQVNKVIYDESLD